MWPEILRLSDRLGFRHKIRKGGCVIGRNTGETGRIFLKKASLNKTILKILLLPVIISFMNLS